MSRSTAGSNLRRLDDISPSIIGIGTDQRAAFIVDGYDIPLQIYLIPSLNIVLPMFYEIISIVIGMKGREQELID
jgi:hypothetical protein